MSDIVITDQYQMVIHCTPLITDIMIIQKERDIRMDAMQDASLRHKAEHMSREAHMHLFEKWHRIEASLRSTANGLYIQAESESCL